MSTIWTPAAALALIAASAAMPLPATAHSDLGMTYNEVARSYGDTATQPGRVDANARVAAAMARLDQLCQSPRASQQRKCAEAWRAIHKAHARMEAKRANAEPAR